MGIKNVTLTNKSTEDNLKALLTRISPLAYVLDRLSEADIRYGLYAGSHVAVLANNRVPTDVDFLVHDDDLAKLRAAFPFAKTKDLGDGVFLYVGEDDAIEFMGVADVVIAGKAYPFRLTDLAASKLTAYQVGGSKINLVDPADTVLLKALLRRGIDQGKHDLEDIKAVLAVTTIDSSYLTSRLAESGSLDRTKDIWEQNGIALDAGEA